MRRPGEFIIARLMLLLGDGLAVLRRSASKIAAKAAMTPRRIITGGTAGVNCSPQAPRGRLWLWKRCHCDVD